MRWVKKNAASRDEGEDGMDQLREGHFVHLSGTTLSGRVHS